MLNCTLYQCRLIQFQLIWLPSITKMIIRKVLQMALCMNLIMLWVCLTLEKKQFYCPACRRRGMIQLSQCNFVSDQICIFCIALEIAHHTTYIKWLCLLHSSFFFSFFARSNCYHCSSFSYYVAIGSSSFEYRKERMMWLTKLNCKPKQPLYWPQWITYLHF